MTIWKNNLGKNNNFVQNLIVKCWYKIFYLWSVKYAFDLHDISDVPGVLGERAQGKSIFPYKRWRPTETTRKDIITKRDPNHTQNY